MPKRKISTFAQWQAAERKKWHAIKRKGQRQRMLTDLEIELLTKLQGLYEWLDDIGDGAPDASPFQKRALNESAEIKALIEKIGRMV